MPIPKLYSPWDFAKRLDKLADEHCFPLSAVTFRIEDDCMVIEGTDKEHELVIYSDLTSELRSI